MTNFKMTVRADCAVSTRSLLHLSIKALAHWLSWTGGETGSGQVSTLPPPWVAGIQNKASFPFYKSSLCTGFWVASSWTPLSITTLYTYSPLHLCPKYMTLVSQTGSLAAPWFLLRPEAESPLENQSLRKESQKGDRGIMGYLQLETMLDHSEPRNRKMHILNVYFKMLMNKHEEGLFLPWSYVTLSWSCQTQHLPHQRKDWDWDRVND